MITKKDIQGLELSTIEEYYKHIIESYLNNQKEQAKKLFLAGTHQQRKDFFTTLEEEVYYGSPDEYEPRHQNDGSFSMHQFFWDLL